MCPSRASPQPHDARWGKPRFLHDSFDIEWQAPKDTMNEQHNTTQHMPPRHHRGSHNRICSSLMRVSAHLLLPSLFFSTCALASPPEDTAQRQQVLLPPYDAPVLSSTEFDLVRKIEQSHER